MYTYIASLHNFIIFKVSSHASVLFMHCVMGHSYREKRGLPFSLESIEFRFWLLLRIANTNQ